MGKYELFYVDLDGTYRYFDIAKSDLERFKQYLREAETISPLGDLYIRQDGKFELLEYKKG